MLSKLLPLVLLIAGIGAGIGAALLTAPTPHPVEDVASTDHDSTVDSEDTAETENSSGSEFVKLTNDFVVPLVKGEKVVSMMLVSLSLEIAPGFSETVYAREPKLRDLFLRVLFDHAHMGGFRGAFTQAETLDLLRGALREVARKELGRKLRDVLIVDIIRQDV